MARGNIVTIGSFDGVHIGHQALLTRTRVEAAKRGLKSLALTFDVPPKMVLDKEQPRFHSSVLFSSMNSRPRVWWWEWISVLV